MHSAQESVRTIATVSSRNASASSAARSAPSSGTSCVVTAAAIGGSAKMQTMASGIREPVSLSKRIMALKPAFKQRISFEPQRGRAALFNLKIVPFRFAGASVSFFAGPRDCAGIKLSFFGAERKFDMAAMLAGMAYDARSCGWRDSFGGDEIREFFVFITQRAAFQ